MRFEEVNIEKFEVQQTILSSKNIKGRDYVNLTGYDIIEI